MNTPVNSTIAQVLKEKGFDEKVFRYFDIHYETPNDFYSLGSFENWNVQPSLISAPTIAEVVMWLYEKHGIWITVYTMEAWPNGNKRKQLFDYSLKQMRFGLIDIPKKPEEFNSPTEAYEAAIEFTLKNLI